MATFCKTSTGGLNFDNVTDWLIDESYPDGEEHDLIIFFNGTEQGDARNKYLSCAHFDGDEADRLIEILNGICLWDTTQERTK